MLGFLSPLLYDAGESIIWGLWWGNGGASCQVYSNLFFWQDPLLPQNSLTDGKPPKQAFSPLENTCLDLMIKKATVGALKKKNVSKSLLPQHALQQSSTKTIGYYFSSLFPSQSHTKAAPWTQRRGFGQRASWRPGSILKQIRSCSSLQKDWSHKISFPNLHEGFQKGRQVELYFTGEDPKLFQKGPRCIKGNAAQAERHLLVCFFPQWQVECEIPSRPISRHVPADPRFCFHYCLQVSFRI